MHSPTHLTNFLSCNYLSILERAAGEKLITKPFFHDPLVKLLQRQGQLHEKNYLHTLKQTYKNIVELSHGNFDERVQQTIAAMKEGKDVIYQGALTDGEWRGYSDFLVKTNSPSKLGNYSYNIVDTKLSAEVKSEAILQLCIYAELVAKIQDRLPDEITIVGGTNEKHTFNPSDFTAYLRYVKKKYLESLTRDVREAVNNMPEPVEHCHTCDWRSLCEEVWHTADHLKLVAGTSKLQRKELQEQGTNTLIKLAQLPAQPELPHSSPESTAKIYKQAKIQLKGRVSKKTEYEFILPVIAQQGLAGIPVPSEGDIWFDIEGDTYIGELGLEYLFGWVTLENSTPQYHFEWAKNNTEERHAIEKFIRVVLERRKEFPGMHVYHYGHYEESVVKRLSTRYNLLVDEVDDLLRNKVFINLLRVVKNGLRLSVEGYGLKEIEGHFGLVRNTDLWLAARARKSITLLLDTGSVLNDEMMNTVRDYNMEDCLSTYQLHQWLEQRRDELIKTGTDIPRFIATPLESKENIELEELAILSEKLYKLLPEDLQDLTPKQKAIKSLADLMLWYRREDKSHWWEHFRMKDLTADELMEERKGLGGPFEYLGVIGEVKKSKVHRWKFLPQPFDGADDDLYPCGEEGKFNAHNFDPINGWLDVKMGAKLEATLLPKINNAQGLFASSHIKANKKIARIKELAEWVLANEIDGEGEFPAARNLLLKKQLLKSSNGSLR
ncbi:MAG TPA: TM0106 family RecB-like putative nuclease, partial [Chitinophagales bacterium]|nr:TM0106 family RecB-like putative nuclease [Chitinophagales bacterium]